MQLSISARKHRAGCLPVAQYSCPKELYHPAQARKLCTPSWSHSMEQIGISASSFLLRDRNKVPLLSSDVPRADTHAVEDIVAVVDWLTAL